MEHWSGALKDAIRFTKYEGHTLEVVMAHPQLTHQLVETPPIKGMMLQRYLKRQVDKVKTFAGNAAWAWQPGQVIVEQANKQQNTATVHFMPEEMVHALSAVAEKYGLHLQKVVPLTEILLHRLRQIQADQKQVLLMAAASGNDTLLVVSEKSGPLHVVRTLKSHWQEQPDQLATDLNRTMLYIQQTFGVEVAGVWMMGVREPMQQVLTPLIHSNLHFSYDQPEQGDWMRCSEALQRKAIPNLISASMLRAPQLRMVTRIAAVITGMLTLSAVLIGSGVEYVLYQAQKRIDLLEPKLKTLQQRESKLTAIQEELNRKRAAANALASARNQNAAHWLLAYLGEAVPVELQITEMNAEQKASGWEVRLNGVYHGTYQDDSYTAMDEVMEGFKAQLSNGPFHMQLESTRQQGSAADSSPAPDAGGHWMMGLSRARKLASTSSTNRFQLKGTIQ